MGQFDEPAGYKMPAAVHVCEKTVSIAMEGAQQKSNENESEQQPLPDARQEAPDDETQPSVRDVKIERHSGIKRVVKQAVLYCKIPQSMMTEKCVEELGFPLVDKAGKREKSIKLTLGPGTNPIRHNITVIFEVVPAAEHDIMLNRADSEKFDEYRRGENFPIFPVPVSDKTRKKREQERKERLAQERQAFQEKMKDELRKQENTASARIPGARL